MSPIPSSLSAVVVLIQTLIQCPSITPAPDQTFHHIEAFLRLFGFEIHTVVVNEVTNFFAIRKGTGPHICFAGHVDVVPPGDEKAWSVPPFEGRIQEGYLWGRGVADMKGAIGCFMMAVKEYLETHPDTNLSLSLLLTSDEEGPAIHGTKTMVPWLVAHSFVPDVCLIGEPTGTGTPGEHIKIGRRGSVTGRLDCLGTQGHIAYPHLADNPIPRLLDCLKALITHPFDTGTDMFQATHLEVTSVDVGNPTTNVIPGKASTRFGIRFNPLHTGDSISQTLRALCNQHAGHHTLDLTIHGEAFLTTNQSWIQKISSAIAKVTGTPPILSTNGGTTDGRFLSAISPIIECGLPETTIHKVDERVAIADIETLKRLYLSFLESL